MTRLSRLSRYSSLSLLLLLAVPTEGRSQGRVQQHASLIGRVRDAISGESLRGARVEIAGLKRGDLTDSAGYYSIADLPAGPVTVEVHYLGYEVPREGVTLVAGETVRKDFALRLATKGHEVTVEGSREAEIDRTSVSRVTLSPTVIEAMPAVGGESDLFRTLQMLPGVKSLSEISSGLYIRGGSPDQNLILLDNNVVYNPTHLFGFFSTFNTDAIKNVDLMKGGYPAEYGGRLTGVLNVSSREGTKDGLHGKTAVSFISARQTLEFPFLNGSALVSGRRTYIDAFLNVTHAQSLLGDSTQLPQYYFYDLNAKIDQQLGPKDHLSLTGYYGADHMDYPGTLVDILLAWGNRIGSAEWLHVFDTSSFLRTFAGYSGYSSQSLGRYTSSPYEFDNGIQEYALKEDFDWKPAPKHELRIGAGLSRFSFSFYNVLGNTNKPLKDTGGVPYYLSAYAQDEWHPNARITANYGLRAEYLDQANAVTLDPRVTLSYQLSPDWTLKASTGIYHQFLHLVSIGEFTFFDLWVPGVSPLPPSQSIQYILGVSGYPMEDYFFSCEAYYKDLKNIVGYNETKFQSSDLTQLFPLGTGRAYGVEFFLQKRVGRLTGWLGYTLSFVRERIDSINNGQEYSPKYDQRHDVQLVLNYKFNDRWEAGLTWNYATGQAYTSTLGYYHVGLDEVGYMGTFEIPGYMGDERLPAYHRADASLSYSFQFFGNPAKASLEVFNVYSHRNVWFRVVDTDKQPAQISDVLLLPVIPTLSLEVSY